MSPCPTRGACAALWVMLVGAVCVTVGAIPAKAQGLDVNMVAAQLDDDGFYLEPGALGSVDRFETLVAAARSSDDRWYFVSLAEPPGEDLAGRLRHELDLDANVLVFFLDGDFEEVELATGYSDSIEGLALAPFDGPWVTPDEFMLQVVRELDALVAPPEAATDDSAPSKGPSAAWLAVPVALVIGGIWLATRRSKRRSEQARAEATDKLRVEVLSQLDELANDVIVLAGRVDLSENDEVIRYYREAAETFNQLPEFDDEPQHDSDLDEATLREVGATVVHARWQMDCAEALMSGDPTPPRPEVHAPKPQIPDGPVPRPVQVPTRQGRPRTSFDRGGGALLDILIGAGQVLGGGRSRGGPFGVPQSRSRRAPRYGSSGTAETFGSRRSSSRSSRSRRSSSRSSRSRRSSSRAGSSSSSSSRRRRRR